MTTMAAGIGRFLRSTWSIRIVVSLCLAAFAGLAVTAAAAEARLLDVDTVIQTAVIESRTGWLDTTMVWLTELGTRYVIGLLAFGLVLWSAITGKARLQVAVIVAAVLLNPLVEVGFKELVGRVRPSLSQLLPGNGPSFPSGHVLASVGFFGVVPFFVWEQTSNLWARLVALAGSLAVIATVAASRVYLGVHWTTDVVAGLLLGAVLVAATKHACVRLSARRPVPA